MAARTAVRTAVRMAARTAARTVMKSNDDVRMCSGTIAQM